MLNCDCHVLAFVLSGLVDVQSCLFSLVVLFWVSQRLFYCLISDVNIRSSGRIAYSSSSHPGHSAVHHVYWPNLASSMVSIVWP